MICHFFRYLSAPVVLGVLGVLAAQPAAGEILVDRIVAVVDDDLILASDIDRLIRLGLAEARPEEDEHEFRRRLLDELIVQLLRLHEVERYGVSRVPVAAVDRQLEELRSRFPGGELEERLDVLGLDEDGLRHLLTRQLRVLDYVEERLAPRIFVDLDDLRAYYDTVLAAEMARLGAPLPPFPEVREAIRTVLHERRLNAEIERWTEELRARSDIEDYFDRSPPEPPEVVKRWERDGHGSPDSQL